MGTVMRSLDWSQTPLGPAESWSVALRATVSLLLANGFPLLLWWGPKYCQIYNDAYRPVLGDKHPRSMGQPASECFPEIWHIIGPLIDTPFRGGPPTWMEDIALEYYRRSDFLEEAHFTVAYSPVPDRTAPGGIGGVLATVHDITEKVIGERRIRLLRDLGARAGEAKSAEEACLIAAQVLENYPKDVAFALLYLCDPQYKIARLAGAAGVAIGERASPLEIGFDDAATAIWPLSRVVRGEMAEPLVELSGSVEHAPPGPWSDPPTSAVLLPIRSNGGHQPTGVLVMGVSARLRFDDSYRAFAEIMANQVATAISNARAYEEERRRAEALAEIDRAKTTFFSNVSHEFRTPLTLMLGPLEAMLGENRGDRDERAALEIMHRNGLRLQRLVNSLLDFSRIEAGRMRAALEPVDLSALTRDLAGNFQSAMDKAGLIFTIDCPPATGPVFVDREMWEKIVLNLISNAVKFTLAGVVTVSLATSGADVELTVSDTGTGIPAHELPHLFERFHRVEGAQGRSMEGSGIGLALVQELVKLHGGTVRVESELGKGSAFHVVIPRNAPVATGNANAPHAATFTALQPKMFVEEAMNWLPRPAPGPLTQHTEARGRGRVLLADDNADMRDYVQRVLAPRYEVIAAADGEEALRLAKDQPPALILSDVMMPRLDGFGLLREIRNDPRLRTIPLILLSARAGEEARVDGLDAGADDYLTKPFTARELLARVNSHLKLAESREEALQAVRRSETEVRENQLRLSRQIAEFETLFKELPLGVAVSGRNGESIRINPALARLLGAPEERGKEEGSDIHRDLFPVQVAAQEGREIRGLEFEIARSDGAVRLVLGHAVPLFDREGEISGAIGVFLDITERKREERLQAEQKNLLEMIASGRPLEECLLALTESVSRLHPGVKAAVVLADKSRQRIERMVSSRMSPSLRQSVQGIPIDGSSIGSCAGAMFSGEPVACAEIAGDERWSKAWRDVCLRHNIRAALSTPVFQRDGKAVASFFLCLDAARQFNDWELRIAEFGSYIVSIVLEHERLSEELRATEARLSVELADMRLLQGVSAQLIREDDSQALYESVLDAAMAIMRSDFASMQMFYSERGAGELRLLALRGFSPQTAKLWEWVREDSGSTCGIALRSGKRTIVPDFEQCDFLVGTETLAVYLEAGIHAGQSTPLFSRNGRLVGMISTHWRDPHEPTERDLHMFDLVARQAADVIDRRTAQEAINDLNKQLTVDLAAMTRLQQVSTRLVQASDFSTLLHEILDAAIETTGASKGNIQLLDAGVLTIAAQRGFTAPFLEYLNSVGEGQAVCGAALARRERVVVEDVERSSMFSGSAPRIMQEAEVRAIQSSPLFSRSGRLLGMFSTHYGTPYHPSDKELRTLDLLARQAADFIERTQAERALRRSMGELRRANSDLEQFAYSASHDLQEPIRNIAIYSEVLGNRYGNVLDAQGQRFLGFITAGARRMEALVKDLLTYTKSGNVEDSGGQPVRADVALKKALANLAETIHDSNAEISSGNLPALKVREVHLEQLFQNLIGNAIKYRRPGESPRIRIDAQRQDDYWQFSVQDNGIGIAPEHREKVFGIFKRLHTQNQYSGTGIGLAICQRIVERNGGRIWVESEGPGKGSIFLFTLPA